MVNKIELFFYLFVFFLIALSVNYVSSMNNGRVLPKQELVITGLPNLIKIAKTITMERTPPEKVNVVRQPGI